MIFLLLHFTLVFIFAIPHSGSKTRIGYWADYYSYPYFLQNWSLFAPVPVENYKVFIEFDDEGLHKQDLLLNLLNLHRENRLAGYETALLSICNSIHYFEKSTGLQEPLNGPVKEDINFNILERELVRFLNWKYKIKLKSVKFILYTSNIKSGKKRVYYNMAWETSSLATIDKVITN